MSRLRPSFPWFRLAPLPSAGVAGSGTINELAYWATASSLGTLAVATYPSLTELTYVKGVTSAIQTQLDGKVNDVGDTMTGLLTIGLAGNALTLRNTTDANAVQVAIFEGDRATMADNDEAYVTLRLSNDGGTQTEVARITWAIPDVNAGTSVDGRLDFAVMTAGTLADELQLSGADLSPSSDDGLTLGTINLQFSDLFLASGGVVTFGNDVTITHSTKVLSLSGGTTAAEFRFLEPSGSGTNYSGFKAVAQAASIDYSLPPAVGAAGTVLTDAAGNGVLTWGTVSGAPTVTTMGPLPAGNPVQTTLTLAADNTTLHVGLIYIPANITVNKLSIRTVASGVDGTLKIALFSLDGATRHINIETATITGAGVITETATSGEALTPGYYYIGVLANGTANIEVQIWGNGDYLNNPTSEPIWEGTLTVTASTMPATITPGSITAAGRHTLMFRLDN